MAVDDAYTKLLLHCDGADNATTITDEAGKTVTPVGNACLKTAYNKFGTASGYLDGVGDCLTIPDSVDFHFGTGAFTIDLQIYLLSYPTSGRYNIGGDMFGVKTSAKTGWHFQTGNNIDSCRVTSKLSGAWADNLIVSAGGGIPLNSWTHMALVRNGDSLKIYKNGVCVGTKTGISTWVFSTASPYQSGYFYDGTDSAYVNGYIDELRVSKGIARWTADFTPSAVAYEPAVANNRIILATFI